MVEWTGTNIMVKWNDQGKINKKPKKNCKNMTS